MSGQAKTDPATRPEVTATALAKAAIQTTQRALFTAQLAAEALRDVRMNSNSGLKILEEQHYIELLKDNLLDAFSAVPKEMRDKLSAVKATLTSDELIDLLALSVQG